MDNPITSERPKVETYEGTEGEQDLRLANYSRHFPEELAREIIYRLIRNVIFNHGGNAEATGRELLSVMLLSKHWRDLTNVSEVWVYACHSFSSPLEPSTVPVAQKCLVAAQEWKSWFIFHATGQLFAPNVRELVLAHTLSPLRQLTPFEKATLGAVVGKALDRSCSTYSKAVAKDEEKPVSWRAVLCCHPRQEISAITGACWSNKILHGCSSTELLQLLLYSSRNSRRDRKPPGRLEQELCAACMRTPDLDMKTCLHQLIKAMDETNTLHPESVREWKEWHCAAILVGMRQADHISNADILKLWKLTAEVTERFKLKEAECYLPSLIAHTGYRINESEFSPEELTALLPHVHAVWRSKANAPVGITSALESSVRVLIEQIPKSELPLESLKYCPPILTVEQSKRLFEAFSTWGCEQQQNIFLLDWTVTQQPNLCELLEDSELNTQYYAAIKDFTERVHKLGEIHELERKYFRAVLTHFNAQLWRVLKVGSNPKDNQLVYESLKGACTGYLSPLPSKVQLDPAEVVRTWSIFFGV